MTWTTQQQDIALRSFQQVDRQQNEQQGMGLGLPLTERIIRTHSGELTLVSVVEKGTQSLSNFLERHGDVIHLVLDV